MVDGRVLLQSTDTYTMHAVMPVICTFAFHRRQLQHLFIYCPMYHQNVNFAPRTTFPIANAIAWIRVKYPTMPSSTNSRTFRHNIVWERNASRCRKEMENCYLYFVLVFTLVLCIMHSIVSGNHNQRYCHILVTVQMLLHIHIKCKRCNNMAYSVGIYSLYLVITKQIEEPSQKHFSVFVE